METRMEKYYKQDTTKNKRTIKNQHLYKEAYGNYQELENLPIPDNTNEIDINKLKELLALEDNNQQETNTKPLPKPPKENLNKETDLSIKEQKIHDINQLLEKARQDNIQLKETSKKLINTNYNFLETLEENRLTVNEIQKAKQELEDTPPQEEKEKGELYQTKRLSDDPTIDQVISKDTLPLDLLSDLKSDHEDTIVTRPIKDVEEDLDNLLSNDANDIPIEKPITAKKAKEEKDNDENPKSFYSGAYKFSKKDFEGNLTNDDFFDDEEPKNHYFLKIIFLIIGLSICFTIIYFFIKYYGISV